MKHNIATRSNMNTTQESQLHLSESDRIHLGSYYTKAHLVDLVYRLILKHVANLPHHTILDSACGYGAFFNHPAIKHNRKIGADIDVIAAQMAKAQVSDLEVIQHNSLSGVSRDAYGLRADDKLIMVGNPPYNDTTSLVRPCHKNRKTTCGIPNLENA